MPTKRKRPDSNLVPMRVETGDDYVRVAYPLRLESSPNQRIHWAAQLAIKKKQFDIGRDIVLLNALHLMGRRAYSIELLRIGARACDRDNIAASFKHIQDGVCDTLGLNDGDRTRVRISYGQCVRKPVAYGIIVAITATDAEYEDDTWSSEGWRC